MAQKQSIDELVDRYLNYLLVEKGLARKTLESYSSDIARYIDFLKENNIDDIATLIRYDPRVFFNNQAIVIFRNKTDLLAFRPPLEGQAHPRGPFLHLSFCHIPQSKYGH